MGRPTLREVLADPGPEDPHDVAGWIDDDVCLARPRRCWAEVAQRLSVAYGGVWIPRDSGVTWTYGRSRAYLLDPAVIEDIRSARSILLGLGLDAGWSIGSCASALLKWAVRRQWPERGIFAALGDDWVAYHDCRPGQYDQVVRWDAKSYYYGLLCRLPSLHVHLTPKGLLWSAMTSEEWDRWWTVLTSVRPHKTLRNALWGIGLGTAGRMKGWHKGEPWSKGMGLGPVRPAMLVVARTAWELAREAADQVDSVYSVTDSVTCEPGRVPTVWTDLGIDVRQDADGSADICAPGIYRIGHVSTHYYRRGSRWTDAVPRKPRPEWEVWREWIGAA